MVSGPRYKASPSESCSLSDQDAGTLAFANILLSSVAQPVFGYYADKVSKPWFAPLGIIITGISLSAMAFYYFFYFTFPAFRAGRSGVCHLSSRSSSYDQ